LGISAKNQMGLVKQQFGVEMPWLIVVRDRNPKNRRAEGKPAKPAEIKCERRTAPDAPMYLRHRYWQRVGVPEAGIA
jgi:hypothetical protein